MKTQDRDTTLAAKIESLIYDLDMASEHYGDVQTQYAGECAAFGDAWPGAEAAVERALASMRAIEAEIECYISAEALLPGGKAPEFETVQASSDVPF